KRATPKRPTSTRKRPPRRASRPADAVHALPPAPRLPPHRRSRPAAGDPAAAALLRVRAGSRRERAARPHGGARLLLRQRTPAAPCAATSSAGRPPDLRPLPPDPGRERRHAGLGVTGGCVVGTRHAHATRARRCAANGLPDLAHGRPHRLRYIATPD